MKTNILKWKSVKLPDAPREFCKPELDKLSKLTFGTKPYDKSSEQARNHINYTITLIEMNGGLDKGCSLAVHELGKILGSVRTAQRVLDCINPILICNNQWDRKSRIAKKYKIADDFKNCKVFHAIKNNAKQNELTEIETLIEKSKDDWRFKVK